MSLMHNIRNWSEFKLQGIIPWSAFTFPDTEHTDTANCVIQGKSRVYRIAVTSSYAHPPLGHVVFTDTKSGEVIEGDNQDAAWHNIAEHLRQYEQPFSGPVAAPEAAPVRVTAPVITLPQTEVKVPSLSLVWYVSDPGVWYQNGPAVVTRENKDGTLNLTVMPDGSEPFYRQNVGQRSDVLRNVCWVPYSGPIIASGDIIEYNLKPATEITRIPHPDDNKKLKFGWADDIDELRAEIDALKATIGRLKESSFDGRKAG